MRKKVKKSKFGYNFIFQALKPTAKITHKGEIEIERFDDTLDRANEFNQEAREEATPSKTEVEKKDEKQEKKTKKNTTISAAELETINRMGRG